MALSIRVPDASFSKNIAQLYPYPENAKLISFFGGDDSSLSNLVLGSEQLTTKIGSPIYGSNYVEVSDANQYINTNITIEGKFTFIAVVKDAADSARIMGTHVDGAKANVEYLGTNAGVVRFDVEGNNGSLSSPLTGWRFLAGSISELNQAIYAYNGDSQNSTSYDRDISVTPEDPLRVGGYNPAPAAVKVGAIMVYDRGLSSLEIENVYKWMKEKMAIRGANLA